MEASRFNFSSKPIFEVLMLIPAVKTNVGTYGKLTTLNPFLVNSSLILLSNDVFPPQGPPEIDNLKTGNFSRQLYKECSAKDLFMFY